MSLRSVLDDARRAVAPNLSGKPPCHLPEVESDIIASVTSLAPRYRTTFEELDGTLRAEFFHGLAARLAWEACSTIAAAGQRPTLPLVTSWLRERGKLAGDIELWVRNLRPGCTDLSTEELARRLVDAWRQRELGWRLMGITAACYEE